MRALRPVFTMILKDHDALRNSLRATLFWLFLSAFLPSGTDRKRNFPLMCLPNPPQHLRIEGWLPRRLTGIYSGEQALLSAFVSSQLPGGARTTWPFPLMSRLLG